MSICELREDRIVFEIMDEVASFEVFTSAIRSGSSSKQMRCRARVSAIKLAKLFKEYRRVNLKNTKDANN